MIDWSKVVTTEEKSKELEKAERAQFKAARSAAVASIVVTTEAGNIFDGDETSQDRMARAILGLQSVGPTATVGWVLADNTAINTTAAELAEALALAGAEQSRLWVAS
jgi:hypothetical protein